MFPKSVYSFIEKNRFTVIAPIVAICIWIGAAGCTPVVSNPAQPGEYITAVELDFEFEAWQDQTDAMTKRFEFAAQDLERQKEQQAVIKDMIVTLASGSVTSWSGLVPLLMGSGLIGLAGDNIRKNGVIGGLKRNREAS